MSSCVFCGLSLHMVKRCGLSVGFHQFPTEPTLRQAWEDFCGGAKYNDPSKPKRAICSDHFAEECFRGAGKRVSEPGKRHVLQEGAVPTIREGASVKKVQRRLDKTQQRSEKVSKTEPQIVLAPILEPLIKLERVCRICASEDDTLHDLSLEENVEHAHRFSSLTAIEIDATAPWLCDGCLGRLNDAYEFVHACVAAENRRKSLPITETVVVKQEDEVQEVWEEPMIVVKDGSAEQSIEELKEENEEHDSGDDYNFENKPKPKGPQVHVCSACPATFEKKSELFAHVKIHGKSRFPCQQCDRTFARRTHLADHMLSHKSEPSFFCKLCSAAFKNKTNLHRHVKNVHLKLKPFACEECGKQFAQKVKLQQHAETHLKEATIPCEQCDQKFKTDFRLQVHVRTVHRENKQITTITFKCEVCCKEFANKGTLMVHMGSHNEPNLLCTVCGKKYKTNTLLAAHMTTHNPKSFSCDLCPSMFKNKKTLQYHQNVHVGIKPYQCGLCERMFRTRVHLKTHHLSVHTDEKPHECHECHKRFTLKGNLRLHMKVHLGERKNGGEGDGNHPVAAWWSNEVI